MKKIPTFYEAEIRSHRCFLWLMKTEPQEGHNPRWETYRKLRDRLRPHRMPLIQRISLSLAALSGGIIDEEMQATIEKSLTSA